MMSFGELAKMLERAAAAAPAQLGVALAKIGSHTAVRAAEYIGREMPEWPPLAESTVAEKTRLGFVGYVSATDPLLRTGANQRSIDVAVEGLMQVVGSPPKGIPLHGDWH